MARSYLGDDTSARRGGAAKDGHESSDILIFLSPFLHAHWDSK
jgi:hypothetical protein